MRYQQLPDTFDVSKFNSCAHHPLQSWEWGTARQKTGVKVVRIGQFQDNNLFAVFTLSIHQLPLLPYFIGYIPRSVSPTKELIKFLNVYGRKNNLIFIKFEPYETDKNKFKIENYKASPHPLFPKWTQLLDLTKSKDELLSKMKPKTRYNINYAIRNGVTVKELSTDDGFEIFSDLYFKTTNRQKYFGHTKKYHSIIWNSLKKNIAHILIAYHDGIPLCAYELFLFGDRLYYPYGGSSIEKRNLMASNLLMWEAIKFGKKNNAKVFDMWGSLPPDYDRQNSWSGFTKFKEGYGTEFVEFIDSYDIVIRPVLYKLYNIAYWFRERLLQR
ncbi:hypothetical protein COV58_04420 [Candidatus Roizmanbacteria bacterium CG11_big_fil_rev_8_21_14_0_20_36_8]|uniref:Peptidoglycan bridge formation protein FemAB n=2 Tax=Candidatus Roizmaniibacteriota TaxID=1752723 RepID=A0A2M6IT23_9BACT|nr:MAG: hypothetical protein COV58_04420 [Candidatus Roizmanbacteria bacterium CG11_big_fil_rev_8_21_14_0_20_36_8]PIZ64271.1 MAG: hypothetical protein COY14_05045 [Candidatus Roizmanbacteria bacterium CG_4_10_14_0_2_um_filter_36_9]